MVRLKKSEDKAGHAEKSTKYSSVIFINSNVIGQGSDELGEALLKTFLNTLTESSDKPDKVIFMNSGVKMVTQDSPALESLKNLCEQGVEVLACGTCLDYFNLKDKVAVGRISNMYDILGSFLAADKVITI
jgi:selenium metabolism protein YedF